MATYGKARENTIAALRECSPFARKGFGMKGIQGAVSSFGRLDEAHVKAYKWYAQVNDVMFTVVSYATPIAWVLRNGTVVIPGDSYSRTTATHQGLCRTYLARS